MSRLFDVSINELLSGKRLTQDEYKAAAEENLKKTVKASSFTLKEKMEYYKKKWLKEHIAAICCRGIGITTAFVIGIILNIPLLVAAAMLLLLVGHAWRNNTMMAYVKIIPIPRTIIIPIPQQHIAAICSFNHFFL